MYKEYLKPHWSTSLKSVYKLFFRTHTLSIYYQTEKRPYIYHAGA